MKQKTSQAPLALAQLTAQKIVVLGAGLTGLSCVRFLNENGLTCSVNDSRDNAVSVEWDKALIASADILLVSPGIDTSIDDIANAIHTNFIVAGDV